MPKKIKKIKKIKNNYNLSHFIKDGVINFKKIDNLDYKIIIILLKDNESLIKQYYEYLLKDSINNKNIIFKLVINTRENYQDIKTILKQQNNFYQITEKYNYLINKITNPLNNNTIGKIEILKETYKLTDAKDNCKHIGLLNFTDKQDAYNFPINWENKNFLSDYTIKLDHLLNSSYNIHDNLKNLMKLWILDKPIYYIYEPLYSLKITNIPKGVTTYKDDDLKFLLILAEESSHSCPIIHLKRNWLERKNWALVLEKQILKINLLVVNNKYYECYTVNTNNTVMSLLAAKVFKGNIQYYIKAYEEKNKKLINNTYSLNKGTNDFNRRWYKKISEYHHSGLIAYETLKDFNSFKKLFIDII